MHDPKLLALWLLLAPGIATAAVNAVGIRVGEHAGSGMAVSRGVDCFVVTVNHLVDKPYDIRIIGRGRRQATAEVVIDDELQDLAVLSLPRDNPICGADTPLNLENNNAVLATVTAGYLLHADETGKVSRTNVTVTNHDQNLVLVTAAAGGYLVQSMSGSILFVKNWPIGMLQSIDERNRARILRFEVIASKLESFLPLKIDRDRSILDRRAPDYDALATEQLLSHLNFMNTRAFCKNLFSWAYRLSKDEYADVGYLAQTGPDSYVYRDALVQGLDSTLKRTSRGDYFWRTISTDFGQMPNWPHDGSVVKRYSNTIAACIEINELKKANKFREFVRRKRLERVDAIGEWELEYTGLWGSTAGNVSVILRPESTKLVLELRDLD